MFYQKSNFHPHLARSRQYKSRIGPKHGENDIFKSREKYYIVFMYEYYKLNLFVFLIWKFDKKSNFQSRLVELGLIRAKLGPNESKILFGRE